MIDRTAIAAALPDYMAGYVAQAPEGELLTILQAQMDTTREFYRSLVPEKETYRYAEGKWTPREVVGHLSDSERVFQYRAMRFARNDRTDLPGFEQDDYVIADNANERSMTDLLAELRAVRQGSIYLLRSLPESTLMRGGTANGLEVTVAGLFLATVGHVVHHERVIRERYL
ncbi:MAG: DinB family protein [Bacteroidota bacterium]